MKVEVGSKNKKKVGAEEKVWKDDEITSLTLPSGV
ncbi:inosine/xanthosine triphosphatase, partial [Bacillus cereus]|nr:inosine/xanthosine triphosphatase [Bacillus cereus]